MAELDPTKGDSNPRPANVLAYGHYGTATYDTFGQSWHFLRSSHDSVRPEPSSSHAPSATKFEQLKDVVKHQVDDQAVPSQLDVSGPGILANHALLKVLPEICAANEHALPKASKAAVDHEENNADKIVFGRALVLGDNSSQSGTTLTPIMASVQGLSSDRIMFSCLGREQIMLKDESDDFVRLDIPQINQTDATIWMSLSAVKHIAVSSKTSSHRDSRFAAVTEAGTTIFRPQLHRSMMFRPLQPNPIIEIPASFTGGPKHSHVMFHPQSSDIIAIIDIEGNWSVWTIKGRSSTSARLTQRARLLISGSIPTNVGSISGIQSSHYPIGWHRLCWLGSQPDTVDCILICNKQALFLYRISDKAITKIELNLPKQSSQYPILDMVNSSTSNCEYFVLTPSHILWKSVAAVDEPDARQTQQTLILMACNHFRGRSDTSLSLHILESTTVVWIILCSMATKIMTIYQAHKSNIAKISISQPTMMALPVNVEPGSRILLRNIETGLSTKSTRTFGPWLFKIIALHSLGIIEEATYRICSDDLLLPSSSLPGQIGLPSHHSRHHLSARIVEEYTIDDFIVDDIKADLTIGNYSRQFSNSISGVQPTPSQDHDDASNCCNLTVTYDSVLEGINRNGIDQELSMTDFLHALADLIRDSEALHPYQLLTELSLTQPYLAEIEEDSELASQFLIDAAGFLDPTKGGLTFTQQAAVHDIMAQYEHLVQSWIIPLSHSIPDRTRIAREKLARQIALDLYLSNIIFQPRHGAELPVADEQHLQLDEGSSFPDSPSAPDEERQILTQDTELDTSSKQSPLAAYVQFRKPLPSRTFDNATVEILAHLPSSIDENPEEYSYSQTELELAATRDEIKHQKLDYRTRRKAERLAKSRKRQLERQEQVKKVAFDARSDIPLIASSQLPIRNIQSSQARPPGSSQVQDARSPTIQMSQPERGQFGGRTSKKSKGKGARRAGF